MVCRENVCGLSGNFADRGELRLGMSFKGGQQGNALEELVV